MISYLIQDILNKLEKPSKIYEKRIQNNFDRLSDLEHVVQIVVSRLGMRYDDQNVLDIALIALNSVFRSKRRRTIKACLGNCNAYQVICSGMIAQAFQMGGKTLNTAYILQLRAFYIL